MPDHQTRRDPLPADYQYPTKPCSCPSCRSKLTPSAWEVAVNNMIELNEFYWQEYVRTTGARAGR